MSLADGDLVAKSPADGGLPPYVLDDLLGRPLVRALDAEEAIGAADVGTAAERPAESRAVLTAEPSGPRGTLA